MTENEAKWTERIREWRASAQTAEEFAQGRGFEGSTLRYWASRLRAKAASVATNSAPGDGSAEPHRNSLRVVRVRRRGAPATGSGAPVLITVGAARIEVRPGFDRGLLREVVEALGGAR